MKDRADRLLVSLGLFESRASARAAIEAGLVVADGRTVTKPSDKISDDANIEASAVHPYVSRGGMKLAAALDTFGVDPAGRICLDIGASTGGFTDVLLRRGAAHVFAVDVGREQFHQSLRERAEVTLLEAQDVRELTVQQIHRSPSLLVCDVSFVSMEKILEKPMSLATADADFVGLFKPQFQVGRLNVGKGGIVSDLAATDDAAERFAVWMTEKGWPIQSWIASPIMGGDGNSERLFHAVRAS